MSKLQITHESSARIPNHAGEFQLHLFTTNADSKEHLALVHGTVKHQENVMLRIHSECFTGDVLGSHRCDCNAQLHMSMDEIAANGSGVLIYLRQEGRGIGLLNKLKTYQLQDEGYDTVDANLMIGRDADERSYEIAARILEYFNIQSVQLLTNNPLKIAGLEKEGLVVDKRLDIQAPVTESNYNYLETKMQRMDHKLVLKQPVGSENLSQHESILQDFSEMLRDERLATPARPVVSLSFAQSLDGSIALQNGSTTTISGRRSLKLTHGLRALHQGILVGIGTILVDDPQLTVRLKDGKNPTPVILDSRLRIPLDAKVLHQKSNPAIIVTTQKADSIKMMQLEKNGVKVIQASMGKNGNILIEEMLEKLAEFDIKSVMVEGGAEIITSFLQSQLVDLLLLTISPDFLGGVRGVKTLYQDDQHLIPQIDALKEKQLGKDIIVWGKASWNHI